MTIAVIVPDTTLDVRTPRMLLPIPRFAGSGCLSTDLLTGDNLSHPRTSVRCEWMLS